MTPTRDLTNGRPFRSLWASTLLYGAPALLAVGLVVAPLAWWTPLTVALALTSAALLLGQFWMNRSLRLQVRARIQDLARTNDQLTQEMQLKDRFTDALQQNDQKLQIAMQVTGLAVWDWDIPRRHLHINGPENGFGQRQQGSMMALRDFVHADDFPMVRRALLSHLRGRSTQLLVRYRTRRTPTRWLEDVGRTVTFGKRGEPLRLLGTRRDITVEVEREQELTLAASLFSGNRDPILVLDRNFVVSAVNPSFADLLRRSPKEWVGRHWSDCSHSDLTPNVIIRLKEQGHWEGELLEQRADGLAFPLHISFRTVMGRGVVSHYLGFCRDLSHDRPRRSSMASGHYDDLTGLPNHVYFHQQLDYYRRMDRLPANQVAIGLLNVDHFKQLNAQLGREAGDTLLQDIAARLNQYGAPLMMAARLTADEFGLLFSHFETPERLVHLAEQIVADINRPMLLEQDEVLATASAAVVLLDPANVHECMNLARATLQRAQRLGGNRVLDGNSAPPHSKLNKARAQQALQRLLRQLDNPLRYRPQLHAKQQTLAAIRVSNVLAYKALGDVQSEPLYALAQEMQLEERLYAQLLREACACYQRCRQQGADDAVLLSFPISPRLLLNERLTAVTEAVLVQQALAPDRIELSFPARVLHHDRSVVMTQLSALNNAGFRLQLEDLEQTPTTLTQLATLPIHSLRSRQPAAEPHALKPLLPVNTALLAQFCVQFNWHLCLSRIDSTAQHDTVQRLPEPLLADARFEGHVVSHPLNDIELTTYVQHQTAFKVAAKQVH